MPVIVVSGPEKAGKTTLCRYIADTYGATYRHWGPLDSYVPYMEALEEDAKRDHFVVWDRSWLCGTVYWNLLGWDSNRLWSDAWLCEWRYGRAARRLGVSVVLVPEHPGSLIKRRDETDLPVDPYKEVREFRALADRFGWRVIVNRYNQTDLEQTAQSLVTEALEVWNSVTVDPPLVAGPTYPRVWVIGERPEGESTDPRKAGRTQGRWLPFTSHFCERLGRALGDDALRIGWGNYPHLPHDELEKARLIICAGGNAARYVLDNDTPERRYNEKVVGIRHPSYVYRYGRRTEGLISDYESQLQQLVRSNLGD